MLQWGRDHVIAELPHSTRTHVPTMAASMGPRSRDRGIVARVSPAGWHLSASMGPRSRDRGILLAGNRHVICWLELQWGRDHVIAEFPRGM